MRNGQTKLGAVAVIFLVGTGWAGGSSTNHYEVIKGIHGDINSILYPPLSMEMLSEGFETDISLRGPTRGGTPADFVCEEAKVMRLVNAHQRGEHLRTEEMVYLLRAYELDYREQMENPRREGGYLRQSYYGRTGSQSLKIDAQ